MLYTLCIVLILIASVILILAILVQSPKSGMAANFGAANQVMGVRESANVLEKTTWTLAALIVVLSLVATLAMDQTLVSTSNSALQKDANALMEQLPSSLLRPSNVLPGGGEEMRWHEKPPGPRNLDKHGGGSGKPSVR